MIDLDFTFTAPLWLYQGSKASWHFITVPKEISADIQTFTKHLTTAKKGWRSVRVNVTIGESRWSTSLFPDKDTGCYLLPIKAAIRTAENLTLDKDAKVHLDVPI